MTSITPNSPSRTALVMAPLVMALALAACDEDDSSAVTPPPPPAMTPPPTTFNVARCLNQAVPGTGLTVAGAVVPDTLKINLAAASGFPNGRRLPDPVIDVTLAVIFLDLTRHAPDLFARLPVNPPANDKAFLSAFPYLATPHGTPPLSATDGTAFNFRTDAESAYVRVDRMGMPAVSTALIGSAAKNGYNDASPADDAAGTFVNELTANLTGLTNALADDLQRLALSPCATPN